MPPEGAEPTVFDPPGEVRPDFDGWTNMNGVETGSGDFIDVEGADINEQ